MTETDAARLARIEQHISHDGTFLPRDDAQWLLTHFAARTQALDWQQCHAAELEAQLAARTRRLEDTDAALVACERSRDQAKDALAERTRELAARTQALAAAEGRFCDAHQVPQPDEHCPCCEAVHQYDEANRAAELYRTTEAALAERTRELRTAEHMWNAAEAALSERMRESQQWHKDFVETVARLHAVEQERDTLIAERADTQTRLMFLQEKLDAIAYWLNIGTAPTPHGG